MRVYNSSTALTLEWTQHAPRWQWTLTLWRAQHWSKKWQWTLTPTGKTSTDRPAMSQMNMFTSLEKNTCSFFLWQQIAEVRVPGCSPFSQLQQHENGRLYIRESNKKKRNHQMYHSQSAKTVLNLTYDTKSGRIKNVMPLRTIVHWCPVTMCNVSSTWWKSPLSSHFCGLSMIPRSFANQWPLQIQEYDRQGFVLDRLWKNLFYSRLLFFFS